MTPQQDSFMVLVTAFGTVAGALTVGGTMLITVFKALKSVNNKLDSFFRDWEGTAAVPGRDAVPGVMERLNKLDGELSRNSGKSVKDTVNRIEKRLEEGNQIFKSLDSRIQKLEETGGSLIGGAIERVLDGRRMGVSLPHITIS